MMEIDSFTDELLLRLVMEHKPSSAPRGQKYDVWYAIAKAVNRESGEVVFATSNAVIQRLKFLKTVLANTSHKQHGRLTREMRAMLHAISAQAAPPFSSASLHVRTRSHTRNTTSHHAQDEPEQETCRDLVAVAAANDDQLDDLSLDGWVANGATSTRRTALQALDRYLGAQAERVRQMRHDVDQLRRDVVEQKCKTAGLERELALVQRSIGMAPPGVSTGASPATVEDVSLQRAMLEEMRKQHEDHREQVAALAAVLQESLMHC